MNVVLLCGGLGLRMREASERTPKPIIPIGSDELRTEESPTNPQTTSAECNVLAERDIAKLADEQFCPTFLRNAIAFGLSPRMRFDIVLNNLAGLASTTSEIAMMSDGTTWHTLVHVCDIGEAMASTLEAPVEAVRGEIFNVGDSAQNYPVREIAEIVAEVFTGCTVTFGKMNAAYRIFAVRGMSTPAHRNSTIPSRRSISRLPISSSARILD
jgi:nucleoside-diphosphate-sugar epimerase